MLIARYQEGPIAGKFPHDWAYFGFLGEYHTHARGTGRIGREKGRLRGRRLNGIVLSGNRPSTVRASVRTDATSVSRRCPLAVLVAEGVGCVKRTTSVESQFGGAFHAPYSKRSGPTDV